MRLALLGPQSTSSQPLLRVRSSVRSELASSSRLATGVSEKGTARPTAKSESGSGPHPPHPVCVTIFFVAVRKVGRSRHRHSFAGHCVTSVGGTAQRPRDSSSPLQRRLLGLLPSVPGGRDRLLTEPWKPGGFAAVTRSSLSYFVICAPLVSRDPDILRQATHASSATNTTSWETQASQRPSLSPSISYIPTQLSDRQCTDCDGGYLAA